MQAQKLGVRKWTALLLIGLTGQFAWTIENMYFNVFLYNTISTDPSYIAAMVAWSAAVATVTTLLVGAWSDRVGKRKAFLCAGYLLWGLSTAAFGFVTVENAHALFPAANAVTVAAAMVIVLDCVMTLFGSTANDAAFNAWVTDVTDRSNRARVESVLRRYNKATAHFSFDGVEVDLPSRTVIKDGESVNLTMKEFDLLVLFLQNKNIALFRETLYRRVWGGDYTG